jgi:hypothetical protein
MCEIFHRGEILKLSGKSYFYKRLFKKIPILRGTLEYFEKHESYLSSQLCYCRCSLSRYQPISRCGSIMVTNDVADRGPRPPGMWAQALGLVRAATH